MRELGLPDSAGTFSAFAEFEFRSCALRGYLPLKIAQDRQPEAFEKIDHFLRSAICTTAGHLVLLTKTLVNGVFCIRQENAIAHLGEQHLLGVVAHIREQQFKFKLTNAGKARVAPQHGDDIRKHAVDDLRRRAAGAGAGLQQIDDIASGKQGYYSDF
jgi:hypothetical protein